MLVWMPRRIKREMTPPGEIGREFSAALNAEADHRSVTTRRDASPLSGISYDLASGDFDLVRFSKSPTDVAVRAVVAGFRIADEATSDNLRDLMTLDDFYSLSAFTRRSVVSATRDRNPGRTREGLVAIAMVDIDRGDWRDLLVATGLVASALRDLGDSAALNEVIPMTTAPMAQMIARFVDPLDGDADLGVWGFRKVRTRYGVGFVDAGIEPYVPSRDLIDVALNVAELLEDDVYRTISIRIGTRLPVVWLPGAIREAASAAVDQCTGCVTLSTSMVDSATDTAQSQQLTAFIAEAHDGDQAAALEPWSRGGAHASLASRQDAVRYLVVARTFVAGAAPYESDAALWRFATRLARAL
jgi:hypothetical protein